MTLYTSYRYSRTINRMLMRIAYEKIDEMKHNEM